MTNDTTGVRTTKKQRELLAFIDSFIKGNNFGPSYREIMRALGYKSVSTVAVHVDGLIAGGYLRKRDHSARSIEVVALSQPPELDNPHKRWLAGEVTRRIADGMSVADIATVHQALTVLDMADIAPDIPVTKA